jgi:carboxyl-terminal processing protease
LVITDEDYAAFKQLVHRRHFTYDRQSERTLKSLKEVAEFEGYMEDAKAEFEALEQKLTHNLDRELDRFQKEIKDAIAQEVVVRYFYQSGLAQYRTQDDPDLKKALEVLNDEAQYRKLLAKPEEQESK